MVADCKTICVVVNAIVEDSVHIVAFICSQITGTGTGASTRRHSLQQQRLEICMHVHVTECGIQRPCHDKRPHAPDKLLIRHAVKVLVIEGLRAFRAFLRSLSQPAIKATRVVATQ